MVVQKPIESQEILIARALELLKEADLTRVNFDSKRQMFIRTFKHLEGAARASMCAEAASMLQHKFTNAGRLDGVLYMMACAFASERDWEATMSFMNSCLSISSNAEFFREISIVLLEVADNELGDKHSRIPLGHTVLVILTEMGLLLANRAGQSRLDNSGSARVVEYITTSLLARSNVNSNAMRMSLLHYLARNPVNREATLQLNRVISRFGQSLLEDLFTSFFEDKRRETAAFYFLLEHMNLFLSVSPSLAEMSHTVLRHFMLKYPDDFPRFLASYHERVSSNASKLLPLTKHMSLLLRTAVEVSQRDLSEAIAALLYKHLSVFKDSHTPLFDEHVELACDILQGEPIMRGQKGIIIGEFVQMYRTLLLNERDASKVVSLSSKSKVSKKDLQVRYAKIGEEPSPLESMLLLAAG